MSNKNSDNEDAKLSAKRRKSLSSSTFCGPNRSFPVPDCSHIAAARRLIGRAKVSASTKAKILACVSRKAKSLGCGGTDATEAELETIINNEEYEDTVELIQFLESIDVSIEELQADRLKSRAAKALSKLRNQPLEDAEKNYGLRTLESLLDSVFDSIGE